MIVNLLRESKKRGKYGRPCDRCAARRIRCLTSEDSAFCTGCLNLGEKCTRDRVRKKSGPKNGRRSRSLPDSLTESSETLYGMANDAHTAEVGHDGVFSDHTHPFAMRMDPSRNTSGYEMPQMLLSNMSFQGHSISGPLDPRILGQQEHQSPRQLFDGHVIQQPMRGPHTLTGFHNVGSQQSMIPQFSGHTPPLAQLQYPETGLHISQQPYSIYTHNVTPLQSELRQKSLDGVQNAEQQNARCSPINSEDLLSAFKSSLSPHVARISLESLQLLVNIFQTCFYGYWPVLSLSELILNILDGADPAIEGNHIILNEKNAMSYALCCAVCAAVTTQLSFVSNENLALLVGPVTDEDYSNEAKRVRNLFDHNENPCIETLLSSFFLYAHYANQKGKITQAKMYLREAITMAQILGLHEKSHYTSKSRAEVHRKRKIYYTLLVTERYVCFEEGLPVILDPCIEFPEVADEEHPQLFVGFYELIQIFSVPSKEFFFEMNQYRHENISEEKPLAEKRQWILAVQERLGMPRQLLKDVSTPHKLNIILSKAWIRAIACHITWNNGMLRLLEHSHDCFGYDFPLMNAQEFLMESSYLPNMAFETNGPGICVKLLEMANSLSFTVQQSLDQLVGLSVLESLFGLVNKFKNDVTLPMKVYQGIANLIARHKLKVVPRLIESHDPGFIPEEYLTGTIEELLEDGQEETLKAEFSPAEFSPFSRQISDQGLGMLLSVPSFFNMRYAQMDESALQQK